MADPDTNTRIRVQFDVEEVPVFTGARIGFIIAAAVAIVAFLWAMFVVAKMITPVGADSEKQTEPEVSDG